MVDRVDKNFMLDVIWNIMIPGIIVLVSEKTSTLMVRKVGNICKYKPHLVSYVLSDGSLSDHDIVGIN